VFYKANYARWYTPRLRYALLTINYILLFGGILVYLLPFMRHSLHHPLPSSTVNKWMMYVILSYCLGTDLVLKIIILNLVIRLHRDLSIRGIERRWVNVFEGREQEDRFRRLVISILRTNLGGLFCCVIGVAVFVIHMGMFSAYPFSFSAFTLLPRIA
jgi:hypothetical protein